MRVAREKCQKLGGRQHRPSGRLYCSIELVAVKSIGVPMVVSLVPRVLDGWLGRWDVGWWGRCRTVASGAPGCGLCLKDVPGGVTGAVVGSGGGGGGGNSGCDGGVSCDGVGCGGGVYGCVW